MYVVQKSKAHCEQEQPTCNCIEVLTALATPNASSSSTRWKPTYITIYHIYVRGVVECMSAFISTTAHHDHDHHDHGTRTAADPSCWSSASDAASVSAAAVPARACCC